MAEYFLSETHTEMSALVTYMWYSRDSKEAAVH